MTATIIRRPVLHGIALAALVAVGGASWAAAATQSSSGIAWVRAASDAEVDKAFALGKQSGKPVFLYWGAVWCPPCNQVKATLFSRPDFVERSRAFVPVYVDGDKPGAQKVAARFKVQGYPTMILFKPDGTEITRLPGEVDPQRYLLTLTAGLEAQIPVKELIGKALSKQALTPEQWRLLAYYSWDTDEQQALSTADLPKRLQELAALAPAEVRDRLALKAIGARAQEKAPADPSASEAGRKVLERVLGDPDAVRQLSDVLAGQGETLVKYLAAEVAPRRDLASRFESALVKLSSDPTLSKSDRMDVLDARVSMWKLIDGTSELSPDRKKLVLKDAAQLVAATTDRYERQAVIPGAAHVLTSSGLAAESDELLKMELPRAVAPYYHMLALGSNAKKRSDAKTALYWYEQAWRKSEGPATRIQWGTGYVGNILELAPSDVARVESASKAVIGQLEPKSETFYERNQRSLVRMATRLTKWQGTDPARMRVVTNVKQQLAKTCTRLPANDTGRVNCEKVFATDSA